MSERTPRTWGENVWPTAQQLADWLAVCTPTERVTHATIAIQDAQRGDACLVKNHDALAARLADAEARAEAAEATVQRVTEVAMARPVCVGCFEEDHPCGDPVCDLDRAIREALRGDR